MGEVLEIGLSLCVVLEYLHSRQPAVIFRDLKPANIMLTTSGGIALIDFGIARHFKPGQARDTMPFGSPGYAAPEQYGKAQTTPRTDIYGLGVLLHQLISGNDPSQAPFRFAPLHLQQHAPAVAELEPLIMQMVEMDATKRPESVTTVKAQLQRLAQAWFQQHIDGLRARGLPATARGPVSWQSARPISMGRGAGTGQGQVSVMQQTVGAAGSTGQGSTYWNVPQKKSWNKMAVASLLLGFLSIFVLQFACSGATWVLGHINSGEDEGLLYFLPFLLMLLPAVLAVIFGNIGKKRASTVPGWQGSKDIATTGIALGYIFGLIYAVILLILLDLFLR
jgi:serine/threonine protein kinase